LSIFVRDTPPRFRIVGPAFGTLAIEAVRDDGSRQTFAMQNLGPYWESADTIPEPHQFDALLTVTTAGQTETYSTRFDEHDDHDNAGVGQHGDDDDGDALYTLLRTVSVALTHAHTHRHGNGQPHSHRHDHDGATWHRETRDHETNAPLHEHGHKRSSRTALLLILGSSPMVEGIPAFFAAWRPVTNYRPYEAFLTVVASVLGGYNVRFNAGGLIVASYQRSVCCRVGLLSNFAAIIATPPAPP